MDFKVAGTDEGVTAIQLDVKNDGLELPFIKESLARAKEARVVILEQMNDALSLPREGLSQYAPKIKAVKINIDKIGELIGPGGKNIKKIIAQTGASIDIQDDGRVIVGSSDAAQLKEAVDIIKSITDDVAVVNIYNAKVKRIMQFGAFCEITPTKEGLVHISELADRFVKNVEDVVKIGDEFKVKVIAIDELGRINLSKKQAEATSA